MKCDKMVGFLKYSHIYTFISTLFYGDIVIGKHTCFCKHACYRLCKHHSYRFSYCTINRVLLYPVFSSLFFAINKSLKHYMVSEVGYGLLRINTADSCSVSF